MAGTLLKLAYDASDVDMDFDSFNRMLEDWDVEYIEINGTRVGVFFNKGTEIHFSILPRYRGKWLSKRLVRKLLSPLLDKYGFITTMVPDNKPHGHKIVQKFGFYEVGRIQHFTVYRLERLKWV